MENRFYRNCPKCNAKITYSSLFKLKKANEKKTNCKLCRTSQPPFIRNCPNCNKILEYTTVKNRNRAEKQNKICNSCSAIEIGSRKSVRKKRSIAQSKRIGNKNPFFGKIHSKESKKLMSCSHKENISIYKTKEFREKISSISRGNRNPMYGKNYYDIWVEKYGKEMADEKFKEMKKKISIASSGENNSMYGKPAPKGSGGGWSGWYNGWFFRSLRELSYMICVIEENKYQWESGEKISIPYIDYRGNKRTYRPDFLINEKILIEIKPFKIMSTPNNILKKKAAEEYCLKNNLEYRMIDIAIIKSNEIKKLILDGKLTLTDKYKLKLEENYGN